MDKFRVVGVFRQPHKDCEAETQDCESYAEALVLKVKWKKERKYKKVFIEPID